MKKLLTILCVIALLGVMCVPAMAAESTVPVAAEVPADWTTVYLYAWGSSGEIAGWPGVAMTNVDGWWCAYMPDTMENVIISNGTAQTADLAVDPGMPICVMLPNDVSKAEVEYELPIEVPAADELGSSAPTVSGGTAVYAYVPAEFESCTLYAWGDSGDNGGWPGAAMTKGDDGLWTAQLSGNYANIIIAGNNGSIQTVDLTYAGGECWVVLKEQDASGKYTAAVVYEMPEDFENVESAPAPVPTSDAWYVAGTMNNWTCNDGAYKMDDNGDGTFTFTFAITAGSHALKVTNGTWDVSFGGTGADGNYEFTASADCDVTVDYDGKGGVTVTGSNITDGAGEVTPAPVTGPMYVAGTMNDWTCDSESYKMTDNGNGTYTLVLDLTAGAHSLKVTNGTWDVSFGGDGENGNYDFNVAADGKVTVSFDGTTVTVTEGDNAPEVTEPATTEATEPATTGTSSTTTDNGGDNGGDNGMTLYIIIAAVVLVAGAAVVFIILKKK